GHQNDNQGDLLCNPSTSCIAADRFNVHGFIGGIHAGHNWQSGAAVFGIEADLNYTNLRGNENFSYWPGGPMGELSFRSNWQGSLRGRLGYAADTWLFYLTAGGAIAHGKLTASYAGNSVSDTNTHFGWTIGAGVEKAFNTDW